jgi:hypothetical protein
MCVRRTPPNVNKQPKQLMATAWKPGQSGNPAGRPIGARQRISEKLLASRWPQRLADSRLRAG